MAAFDSLLKMVARFREERKVGWDKLWRSPTSVFSRILVGLR